MAGDIDPDGDAKDSAERRLMRLLRARLDGQLNDIMDLLGDPPDLANLPAEFWDTQAGKLLTDLRPEIEGMAREAAQRAIESGIGVDWSLVAEEAADWASRHTYGLVHGLTDTARRALQTNVERYIREPGRTIGDLRADLEPYFGPVRARMIAVTEVTRGFAEGERLTVATAQAQGFRLEPVWHTNRDELVCTTICAPNDGKAKSEGWTVDWPPAHTNCRCWITHKWLEPAE